MTRICFGVCCARRPICLLGTAAHDLVSLLVSGLMVLLLGLAASAPHHANARVARCLRRVTPATTTRQLPPMERNSCVVARADHLEAPAVWAGNATYPECLRVVESVDRADQSYPTSNRRS